MKANESLLDASIASVVSEKRPFFTIEDICVKAKEAGLSKASRAVIRSKLKTSHSLSWRKASVISHLSNVDRHLIVRQKCALRLLELLEGDKELFNIDESAITSMNTVRRGWFGPLDSGNVSGRQLKNRVNLTLAVSSRGRSFFSTHCETNNTAAIVLQLLHLFDKLKEADQDYHRRCIFILDNAPSHRSNDFLDWAANRPETFFFLSKYSWSLAPAELGFAYIKARRFPINDEHVR